MVDASKLNVSFKNNFAVLAMYMILDHRAPQHESLNVARSVTTG